jgi:hypothetical protein
MLLLKSLSLFNILPDRELFYPAWLIFLNPGGMAGASGRISILSSRMLSRVARRMKLQAVKQVFSFMPSLGKQQ